jgi:hypothetical protein
MPLRFLNGHGEGFPVMPVPRSGTSVFSFGAGVEKIRRCDVELMRWMVLWKVSTGLFNVDSGPGNGRQGAGGLPGPSLSACKYDSRGLATVAFIEAIR